MNLRMKKQTSGEYLSPTIKVVKIQAQQHMLAGSVEGKNDINDMTWGSDFDGDSEF